MLVTDVKFIELIKKNKIIIEPLFMQHVRPASYCLSLSDELLIPEKHNKNVELMNKKTYPSFSSLKISKEHPYILKPGDFILGSSIENVGISLEYTGFLSNISGLARLGLNVLLSTHIASGFGLEHKKKIVFEIYNNSTWNIEIIPNIRICHLILIQNISPPSQGYDQIFNEKYMLRQESEFYRFNQ